MLAATFRNMEGLLAATAEEIAAIDGIGGIMAESLRDSLEQENTHKLIERLKAFGSSYGNASYNGGWPVQRKNICIDWNPADLKSEGGNRPY